MAMSMRTVRFGPPALIALSDEIAKAQSDDPLAPVTVVVPGATVGLAVRRRLASGQVEGHHLGRPALVNTRFVTLDHLADELGGPALAAAGRHPISRAVTGAAVRAELAAVTRGPFRAVRHHPASERALAAALHDLRGIDDDALARIGARSERAAEVVRLVTGIRSRLRGWYDEHDAAAAATAVVRAGGGDLARRVGAVVVHLPRRAPVTDVALLTAMAVHVDVAVLVGTTGNGEADQIALHLGRRFGFAELEVPAGDAPTATSVLSAPSADTEVLLTLRGVMQRQRDGVPLERMAVVHGGTDPYPRLLHESFALAAIPTNGPGVRPLAATMVGRVLVGALALPDHDWRRDEVMAWISGAPIHDPDGPVPATAWDDVSRRAGITSGRACWSDNLERLAATLTAEIDDEPPPGDDDPEPRQRRLERRLDRARGLDRFVRRLSARLDPEHAPDTWAGWARWAEGLLRDHLDDPTAWPVDEQQAGLEVGDRLRALGALDGVGPPADTAAFRRALESELAVPAPRTSRFGQGVLVGPIESVVGLDLDVVFVVGMTEGTFPARVREDPLLPDAERAAGGEDVPLRATRAGEAHHAYLAALASAPERVLSYPRGDQRRGREQRPSRWLLDSLGTLAGGRRLFSRDVADLGAVEGFELVPSFTAAVRSPVEPASLLDHDLRSLLGWFETHGRLDGHPLIGIDPGLRLGLVARHERRRAGFTRFDGRVDQVAAPSPVERRALAPTSLEQYAICPRRYFLSKVLWITPPERPEEVQRISAIDKGNLVHLVLERFITEVIARPRAERIRPGQRWTDADHTRLDVIADVAFAEFEQRGLTGRVLLWELDQATIRRDLHTFLQADDEHRARTGGVPEQAELRFGPDDETPVVVRLSNERELTFKGSADRVDRADDGSAFVLDYKTGNHAGFGDIEGDDPTVRGTKLQLPIYGLAARQRLGSVDVRAAYWFLTERAHFGQIGYQLDEGRLARFHQVVEVIVDGIETGAYPGRPGDENLYRGSFDHCRYCDFDPVCPTDRGQEWERVRGAAPLAAYVELVEGEVGAGPAAAPVRSEGGQP